MPVYYRLDPARGFIRTSCTGEVRLEQVLRHFDELERDPARPSPLNVLLDFTGLETLPNGEQVRAVSDRVGRVRTFAFGACAIVADHDPAYGIARMFSTMAERCLRAVGDFRSRADAELWLAPHLTAPGGAR
ncbi:MAG: hypothetical protein ACRENB_15720 [Gemmatimonadales bacterium]